MNLNDLTLFTCSFNNNLLTEMMLKSFCKQVQHIGEIVIMDNGTHTPVSVITKNTFKVIDNYQHKLVPDYHQVSKNHCSAVDYALKNCICTKWVLLVDNDVLFKPTCKEFLQKFDDVCYDCAGQIGWDDAPPDRIFPYFCMINMNTFRNTNVSFFDNKRCIGPDSVLQGSSKFYRDTGSSFYDDIKNTWRIFNIDMNKYIVHLKASYGKTFHTHVAWLNAHRELF